MPLPRLLHPVPVEVEQLDRVETIVDEDYREPVQQAVRGPRKTVPGQIKWTFDDQLRATLVGAEQEAQGYILFRRRELRAASLEIKQGDRFVKIGTGANAVLVDLYVVGLRYEGHYPDQGGPALVKAFFKDRMPSKQTKGGK